MLFKKRRNVIGASRKRSAISVNVISRSIGVPYSGQAFT